MQKANKKLANERAQNRNASGDRHANYRGALPSIYIYISAAGRKSKCGKVLGQWKRKNKKLIEALAPYLMSINFLALKSNQFSCQAKARGSHLDEAGKAEKRV